MPQILIVFTLSGAVIGALYALLTGGGIGTIATFTGLGMPLTLGLGLLYIAWRNGRMWAYKPYWIILGVLITPILFHIGLSAIDWIAGPTLLTAKVHGLRYIAGGLIGAFGVGPYLM
ncbi:MAG: hypothetical protein ABIG71_02105, partial [Candidatus Uhrbacteria bacterium]